MEDITQVFLAKCKEAGYEKVTIFVADRRVPLSTKIQKQSMGTYWGGIANVPPKVICGYPEQLNKTKERPAMWDIVKECGLTAGLRFGGYGSGDAHDVHPNLVEMLTAGYYDLEAQQ